VLNLLGIYRRHGDEAEYQQRPFFHHTLLNRSLIVKHRLRANELDLFDEPRSTGTKILIPIDQSDLRMGARYMFVGQQGYSALLEDALGMRLDSNSPDLRMLRILDEIPSLDPFLLREQLRRSGLEPARCYFEVSESDLTRMFTFVQEEISPLVNMSFGEDSIISAHSAKLVNKILSSEVDNDLDPLRTTLQLNPQEFEEGIFCWKAFLYYKWQLAELMPRLQLVVRELAAVKSSTPCNSDTRQMIESSRVHVRKRIAIAVDRVRTTLNVYDKAYSELHQSGKAKGFREFLLTAPALFRELGERLAGVDHVVSFWRFRFPPNRINMIPAEELCDLLADFEGGLQFSEPDREYA
jgi:hypothetical protein